MGKRKADRKISTQLDQSNSEARTRQSESPDLDMTTSASEDLSDVNQLNAFGGDRPQSQTSENSTIEGHGENLQGSQSVEGASDARNEESSSEDTKYNK